MSVKHAPWKIIIIYKNEKKTKEKLPTTEHIFQFLTCVTLGQTWFP